MAVQKRLQVQKRQLVRDAIYEAAIDLFAEQSFDVVTIDQVAARAGVSRRSFFRYFAGKDDLLAQNMIGYGAILTEAIKTCPRGLGPIDILQRTVLCATQQIAFSPRTREIVAISLRSESARQAHQSRMNEVQRTVAKAFATRVGKSLPNDVKPQLLASITLGVIDTSVMSWFRGSHLDLGEAAQHVLSSLMGLFSPRLSPSRRVARPKQSHARRLARPLRGAGRLPS